MKIEEKFNKRSADLIEDTAPYIHEGPQYALGMRVTFTDRVTDGSGARHLRVHMKPTEAIKFAQELIEAASRLIIDDPSMLPFEARK